MARLQQIITGFVPGLRLQPEWQPAFQFVRFRKRINIQRPAHPHFERDKVLHVCRPIFSKSKMPQSTSLFNICRKQIELKKKTDEIENPYEKLLAKELLNWFNHSNMIVFFHSNPMSADDKFKATISLKKKNMTLKCYGRKTAKIALENTKFAPVMQLFQSRSETLFSVEPQVAQLLRLLKKIPQLVLLAGIVDGRLMSKTELIRYSQLPDLQTTRAELVGTLNMSASQVLTHLSHHQNTLVGHLNTHIDQQQKESDSSNENT